MKLSSDPQQAVAQLREYLTTADLSRCQAKVVADRFGSSESRLTKVLHKAGTTWQQLKNEERAKRLDRLIEQNRASRVNGVKALGFMNVSSFERFVRRHTGMTIARFYRERRAA